MIEGSPAHVILEKSATSDPPGASMRASFGLGSVCEPLSTHPQADAALVRFDLAGLFNEGQRLLRGILHLRRPELVDSRRRDSMAFSSAYADQRSFCGTLVTSGVQFRGIRCDCCLLYHGRSSTNQQARLKAHKLTEPRQREKTKNPFSM